ncbi:dihydroneopterin aldolase [Aliiroseovarius crassostreae]|uniref:dihydroneopterin aldolase n=1 Tax=Aliiroseovarius crassostreae TaxID=154981 RepID=UPI0022086A6B|nr:dihydroneopterin aldolase [Aliiroseovarius crassostreae]
MENSTAFQPLEARAIEMGGPNPPDRISVRDHTVEVEIGAFQAERDVTQRLRFSVVVEVGPSTGAQTDDVDDILSYDAVTEAITAELAAERLNLLETLAERIAERILREPQPLRVFVRIEKLDRGPGNLGVEIVRGRSGQQAASPTEAPRPRLIHLGAEAIAAPGLTNALDRWEQDAAPVVLLVGPGKGPVPQVQDPSSQRRINLLAIEQNACVLAARDPRMKAVGTRTELDWGMKNGQISVWAPTKMVMDAVDGPADLRPETLLEWLGQELGAASACQISDADGLERAL